MENDVIEPTPIPSGAVPAISIKDDLKQDDKDIEKTAEDIFNEVKKSL